MPEGDQSRRGYDTILAVGEETTLGTYVTATASDYYYSESLKLMRDKTRIEAMNSTRDHVILVQGKEHVEGSMEFDANLTSDLVHILIKQAMGGTVSSVRAATTTIGSYRHTFGIGNMVNNDSSVSAADILGLSFWVRRGDTTTNGFAFRGCRVNQLTISGEVGNPLKISAEVIGIGASLTTFAVTPSFTSIRPLMFDDINVAVLDSIAGTPVTVTAQGFEVSLNNNLLADDSSYQLGQRGLSVLPPGMRNVTAKITTRYDTTTAMNRFTSNTLTAVRITARTGITITASAGDTTYTMDIDLPNCYFKESQPEVGDSGIISQELEAEAIGQATSTTFPLRIITQNATAGY